MHIQANKALTLAASAAAAEKVKDSAFYEHGVSLSMDGALLPENRNQETGLEYGSATRDAIHVSAFTCESE